MRLINRPALERRDTARARLRQVGNGLEVSELPSFGFGHRSMMWWGTQGMMVIEGTVFALAIAAYFYLRGRTPEWPPSSPPPQLLWGTLNVAILLVSLWPNQIAKHAAEDLDLGRTRRALVACLGFSFAFLLVRVLEFRTLNCRWDGDAYGSIVWVLLGLHTVHLIADTLDSIVLTVLLFTGPMEGQRFVDVSENALYWYFVVLSWLPIYGVLYWAPRP
jgi:cytochrome c oxidase subunit I+III